MTDVTAPVAHRRRRGAEPEHGPHLARGWLRAAGFLSALLFTAASAQGAATEFVVPEGPLITLQDGRAIDGDIISIDQTNIVIQGADGKTQSVPRSTVETIVFQTITGQELTGELVGWMPGIYQIATPEAAIKVYSAMPAVAAQAEPKPDAAPDPALVEDKAGEAGTIIAGAAGHDEGQADPQAIAAVSVDRPADVVDDGAATDNVVETQDAAASPTADLSIRVSVENSKENGPPVAFNIELSQPSEHSVVLIYATIDGTALDGKDYEANRGVVVIKPGEQKARIEAPVIDDAESEEQEHLKLFLTVDPTVAIVETRQIIATIDDDDQP